MPTKRKSIDTQLSQGNSGHIPQYRIAQIPRPYALSVVQACKSAPPDIRTYDEKHWWAYYSEQAATMRVFTAVDLMMLARLVKVTIQRQRVEEELEKQGFVIETPTTSKVNPLFNIASALRTMEIKLLQEFGMSPASRKAAQVAPEVDTRKTLRDMLSAPRPEREPVVPPIPTAPSSDAIQ